MDRPQRAEDDGDGSVADFFLAYNKRGGLSSIGIVTRVVITTDIKDALDIPSEKHKQ